MDGHAILVAFGKIVPFQKTGDRVLAAQTDKIGWGKAVHPLGVETEFGLVSIQDLEDLLGIGFGVVQDLLAGERLAGLRAAGRIADHAGEIADQKNHHMPQLLKLAQLVDYHINRAALNFPQLVRNRQRHVVFTLSFQCGR